MRKMIGYILLVIVLLAAFVLFSVVRVRFFTPPSSIQMPDLAEFADRSHLYNHVEQLSVRIGSRSIDEYEKLEESKRYIVSFLESMDYHPTYQDYRYKDRVFTNIIVTIEGEVCPDETIVFGAHYDTVRGTPGADDNASAVAMLLEICRELKGYSPGRTLKLIFFTLEEPPAFATEIMGSSVYANEARARGEDIRGMVCLEMVGYFSEKRGGQSFPLPGMGLIYSTTPNFIAVVGNLRSRQLVRDVGKSLEKGCHVPVETLATVSIVPGVDLSDNRSFWKAGYPAVMITDTAFYRNPNYHRANDTIDTLNFTTMSELLKGLTQVAKDLAALHE